MDKHAGGVRDWSMWLLSTPVPLLDRVLLANIGEICLKRRLYQEGEASMAARLGRHRVTVARALGRLQKAGLIRVTRRGRRLTNVYRLARRIWCAITGRPELPDRVSGALGRFNALRRTGVAGQTALWRCLDPEPGG